MNVSEAHAVLEGVSSTRVKTPETEQAWSTSFAHEPSEPPPAGEVAPVDVPPLPPPPSFDAPSFDAPSIGIGASPAGATQAPAAPASRAWIWGIVAFVCVVGLGVGLWLGGFLGLPHP
jgi:hypothetical protein